MEYIMFLYMNRLADPVESHLLDVTGDRGIRLRNFHEKGLFFFNEARASSHNHQNWHGGYRHHLTQFLSIAQLNYGFLQNFKPSLKDTVSWESIVVVGYFHDIEKVYKYSCLLNDEFDKEAFLTTTLPDVWGVCLTDDELTAIKYIHGEGSDYRKDKRVMSELCAICHMADVASARVLHDIKN